MNRGILAAMFGLAGFVASQSVQASMVLGVYAGNDSIGVNDCDTSLEADVVAAGIAPSFPSVCQVARVDWVFDTDPSTPGNQFLNPQTDGLLTVLGTDFKDPPGGADDSEVIVGTWTTSSAVDYITVKFDGYVAVIDTEGDLTGDFNTAALCSLNSTCAATGKVFAMSHVAAYVVPVPAAVWLFGSGLLGLVGVARRKKVSA